MTPALLLAAMLQTPSITVGDTVWLRREIAIPPGRTVRPADWQPDDPVELLGPPRVVVRGGSAQIAYPVVIWETGERTVRPPGPLLLGPDGSVDSLAPEPMTLRVASVLPVVPPDSTLRPQPRADFVPRSDRTPLPLFLLLGIAGLLVAPLHWWWRRRGQPRPTLALESGVAARAPLERWADAGETRAVAAAASSRLRSVIARQVPEAHPGVDTDTVVAAIERVCPDWPNRELRDLLQALDEARFGHLAFPDAVGLSRWALELEPKLTAPPRGEAAA
jgi:hypothetical protein